MTSFFRSSSGSIDHAALDGISQNWDDNRRRLTDRENEVMSGLARGLLYKEVASELGISYSTVHKHQHSIFVKLGAGNRTEAVTKWVSSMRAVRTVGQTGDSPVGSNRANAG
jgi:DNA-binding NarL/FixJ family response regulator